MAKPVNIQIHGDIAHKLGYLGNNITIAYLDTGISPHKDFISPKNRIITFIDFVNHRSGCYDDNGHGTHITGIAAAASSHGNTFLGVAPQSNIVSIKVLDGAGNGIQSSFIQGLLWIHENYKKYGIQIVNISIGTPPSKSRKQSNLLSFYVNQLWDDGLIVCIASGNHGPNKGTISMPGDSFKIITVGASDDSLRVIGRRGLVPHYSGRGPTKSCIMKPDVVAPGTNIFSCIPEHRYGLKSGTSMATPVVSGAMALLLDRFPNITNKEAKMRLKHCCDQLDTNRHHQGWGKINVQKLLDL